MSELKVASLFEFEKVLQGRSNKLFYSKSEADKEFRKLQRALWLARAKLAKARADFWDAVYTNEDATGGYSYDINYNVITRKRKLRAIDWYTIFLNVYRKCRTKADQFEEAK